MAAHQWDPDPRLPAYYGPYPKYALQNARKVLVQHLKFTTNKRLEVLKPKLHIPSQYGPPLPVIQQFRLPKPTIVNDGNTWTNPNATNFQKNQHVRFGDDIGEPSKMSSNSDTSMKRSNDTNVVPLYTTCASDLHQQIIPLQAQSRCFKQGIATSSTTTKTETAKRSSAQEVPNDEDIIVLDSTGDGDSSRVDTPVKQAITGSNSHVATSSRPQTSTVRSNSATVTAKQGKFYQCDYCTTCSTTEQEMLQHLENERHGTASQRLSIRERQYVIAAMCLKKKMSFPTVRIVCPTCKLMFPDIYACSLHHKLTHASANGKYAQCKVVISRTMSIPQRPVCMKCPTNKNTFFDHKMLNDHWRMCEQHRPDSNILNKDNSALKQYSCTKCPKEFYSNFFQAKAHSLHHKDVLNSLLVQHIELPSSANTRDMIESREKTVTVSSSNVETLQRLKRNAKSYAGGMSDIAHKKAKAAVRDACEMNNCW